MTAATTEQAQAEGEAMMAKAKRVAAAAEALRVEVLAFTKHAQETAETYGLPKHWANGPVIRMGLAVAAAWPLHLSLLHSAPRKGWAASWPQEEGLVMRQSLSEAPP